VILIDTGYLIGLVDPADALRARGVKWAARSRQPMLLHQYVALELLNFFSATPMRMEAHRLVSTITNHPQLDFVPVDMAIHARAIDLHRQRADKEWSLTDCVSFVLMKERGITQALTFDHHFEQAGFDALLRRDPA